MYHYLRGKVIDRYDEEGEILDDYEELKGKIADLTKTAEKPGGISLFTDATKTEYKSTYELLKDIHEIYSDLTDKQQAGLLEALGGKRGGQVIGSVLRNWDAVDKALQNMENSAGNADAEMSIVEQSLTFKINKLKETWVGILQDVTDRGDIGKVIDFLTSVSDGIGSIVSNLGLLKTAIIAVTTIIGSQKLGILNTKNTGTLFGKIATSRIGKANATQYQKILDRNFIDWSSPDNQSFKSIDFFSKDFDHLSDTVRNDLANIQSKMIETGQISEEVWKSKVSGSMGVAIKQGKSLSSAFANIGKTLVNGFASALISIAITDFISHLGTWIDKAIMTEEEAKRLSDSFKDSYSSMLQSQTKAAAELNDLDKEFQLLSKGVNALGENVGLTEEQFERYHDISKTIVDYMPEVVNGYDDQGNAIIRLRGNVESLTEAYKQNQKEAAKALYQQVDENDGGYVKGVLTNFKNNTRTIKYDTKEIDYARSGNGGTGQTYYKLAEADIKEQLAAYQELSKMTAGQLDVIYKQGNSLEKTLLKNLGMTGNMTQEEIEKIREKLVSTYEDLTANIDTSVEKMQDVLGARVRGFTSYYESLDDATRGYVDAIINNLSFDDILREGLDDEAKLKTYATSIVSTLKKLTPKTKEQLSLKVNLVTELNNNQISIPEYLKKLEELNQWLTTLPENERKYIEVIFGITADDEQNIQDGIDHVKELLGKNYSDDVLYKLSADTLKQLSDVGVANTEVIREKMAQLNEENTEEAKAQIAEILSDYDIMYQTINGKPFIVSAKWKDHTIDDLLAKVHSVEPIELETQIKASDTVEAMADMKSAVGTLDDLWRQTVDNQLKLGKDKKYLSDDGTVSKLLDTNNMTIGSADPALLKSVNSAFQGFIMTLSDDDAKDSVAYALKTFNKVMTETPKDAKAAQKAINGLITAYIDQGKVLQKLDKSNKEWHIDQLEAMGITNAREVVETRLIKTNKQLLDSERKLADIFRENDTALADVNIGTPDYDQAAGQVATELSNMFSSDIMGFSSDINIDFVTQNLDKIRQVASGDVDAIIELRRLLTQEYVVNLGLKSEVQDKIDAELANLNIPDLWATANLDTRPFIDGLNGLLKAGEITRDQMNAILSGIGVEPTISYKEVKVTEETISEAEEAYDLEGTGATQFEHAVKTLSTISIPVITYNVTGLTGVDYTPTSTPGSGSSGSSGSGSHANKVNKDSEESFDWIEVKIQRLNEEISRLDKTVGDVYENWTKRNNTLEDELDKVAEEMSVHQHAYERYLANANAVKVSNKPKESDYQDNEEQYQYDLDQYNDAVKEWATGEYKQKVREGLIGTDDIEKIKNRFLVDAINEYKELYQKAVEAQDAIQDDKIKLGELNKTRFDHIKSEFEALISEFEHLGSIVDERISRMEEHGYFVNANYYKRQLQIEKQHYDKLNEEYNKLIDARQQALDSGAIELNSEAYHEMTTEINSVAEAIEQSATATVKWQKSIRDLGFEIFEWIEEKVTNISDEMEFLVGLLADYKQFDEQGYLNDRGYATLGLHTSQYDIAMKQAEDYRDKILEIQQELVDDPSNKEKLDQLDEYKKKEQDAIKAAQSAAENIKSLWSDAFSAQLDYLSKLMDKYKKSLSDAKDLYTYQKNIASQTENIASLEKQLQAYSGDMSEETRATVQNLQKQLKDAQTNLQETEWDRYISETEKVLDDMYDEYETMLNERLDDIYGIIAESVEMTNANSMRVSDGLDEVTDKWGYSLTEQTASIIDGNNIVSNYTDGFDNYSANVLTYLDSFQSLLNQLATDIGSTNMTKVNNEGLADSIGTWHQNDKGWWYGYSDGTYAQNEWKTINGKTYYFDNEGYMATNQYVDGYWLGSNGEWDQDNKARGWRKSAKGWWYDGANGWYPKSRWLKIDGDWYYFDQNGYMVTGKQTIDGKTYTFGSNGKLQSYASGSSNIRNNQIAWTQENGSELIYRKSDGAILTPLNNGDMVFTSEMSRNLWDIAKNHTVGNKTKLPDTSLSARTINNDNEITLILPNVTNYDEFKTQLQKDPKFVNFVQATTIGQALGKGKLNRGNF